MNIYKGLMMMQGYLTTVEREEDARQDGCTEVSGCGPGPGSRTRAPRHAAESAQAPGPVRGLTPGCA